MVSGPTEVIRRFLAQGASPLNTRTAHDKPLTVKGRKVRVLAVVHGWMPVLAAGSERMVQHLLDALPRDRYEVAVLSFGFADSEDRRDPYDYDGTTVYTGYVAPFPPDIIVTHHGPGARVTMDMCEEYPDARVIAVYHNERYDIPDIQGLNADLSVFNTRWVRDALGDSGIVVHPPVEYERHRVDTTGPLVTLVNLQENKGVQTFQRVAERMSDTRFLGVHGTHGRQETPYIPNVTYRGTTQDMRKVWRDTRVVLMPSGYESYGMVAAEACVSGIPVLAHPTPGLLECLGDAGLFVDRDDIDGYEKILRRLMTDDDFYAVRSRLAERHGLELVDQTCRELTDFVGKVDGLCRLRPRKMFPTV